MGGGCCKGADDDVFGSGGGWREDVADSGWA
jgi:hypothetical protein